KGAAGADQRWADHGKLLKKIAVVRGCLREDEYDIVDKHLGIDRSTRPASVEPFLTIQNAPLSSNAINTGQFKIEFYIGCGSQTLLLI
ncbi:hypothetical protein BYT27DRAFT_7190625, partial [Phlegmacium glaucopus]